MTALKDVRILDLTRVLAGPWCTQTLADLGADVWKVEPPGQGDDTRGWRPPEIGGESTYFHCANHSKRSVHIDLKTDEGRAAALSLVDRADVLVENFRMGALERFGLGWEAVHARNPRLIYCSISGYGRTGPRASEPGYDFSIQAESGLMSITGEPDGPPLKYGVAITDLVAGMSAVQAILAALIARGRTGEGQHIDIALLDCAVAATANIASGYLATGRSSRRYGNAHPTVVPYQLFDSADGAFVLAVGNDTQFATLCRKVIARPELAEDERYSTNRARVANRETLIPALQAVFRAEPTAVWIDRLRAAGVPSGKIRSVGEALESPEIAARGLVHEVPDALHGTLRLVGSPLKLSATPPAAPKAPPRAGEHTADILDGVTARHSG
ncbi:CaiB/BaiF CoA-transferase family protein [Paralimibaculum aggregatum]|uniref:CaiB/BaiF CoA-transferase family protein n=1 Tax=Paralimibaculum aggregatum TaxID=3036245 RepID=A0ABQ6LSC2_9RHOB|nr:CaiB/BaiF CoA-transferase family protein [Limibaculum sp. NKW23]GMG84955.1 CaiB/BaiF CoA-transferase family protein [Limibaculum sp. NKW23]